MLLKMSSSTEPGGWKEGRKEGRAVFPRAFPDETLSRAMRAKKKRHEKERRNAGVPTPPSVARKREQSPHQLAKRSSNDGEVRAKLTPCTNREQSKHAQFTRQNASPRPSP